MTPVPPLPPLGAAPEGERPESPVVDRRIDSATRLLRQALLDGWLTAGELSAALDVSPSRLHDFETRAVAMSPAVRLRLAETLRACAPPNFRVYVDSLRTQATVELTLLEMGG